MPKVEKYFKEFQQLLGLVLISSPAYHSQASLPYNSCFPIRVRDDFAIANRSLLPTNVPNHKKIVGNAYLAMQER